MKMMAKLAWRPFASDEQRVEAAGMEGGLTAVQMLVLERDLVVGVLLLEDEPVVDSLVVGVLLLENEPVVDSLVVRVMLVVDLSVVGGLVVDVVLVGGALVLMVDA